MPQSVWIFSSYLIFSIGSLVVALYIAQWRLDGAKSSKHDTLNWSVIAVVGTLLMMIPLFCLVYVGMIPKWRYGITYVTLNLVLPLVWAHLAVYAWGTGKTFWEQNAIGIAFFLTVPVLFLGSWMGAMITFPYSILLVNWGLLLISLTLWLKPRLSFRRSGSRP